MSFYFQTSSIFRNDGATGAKGCAASREDPLGRRLAPQRALDDDAAPRPRQGLALENGQSPHALLAHRVAADERHRRGVEANRAGGGGLVAAPLLGPIVHSRGRTRLLGHKRAVDDRVDVSQAFEARSPDRRVVGVSGLLLRVVEPDVARLAIFFVGIIRLPPSRVLVPWPRRVAGVAGAAAAARKTFYWLALSLLEPPGRRRIAWLIASSVQSR